MSSTLAPTGRPATRYSNLLSALPTCRILQSHGRRSDGDGELDTGSAASDEAYLLEQPHVNFGGRSYKFDVDRNGERLTLTPLVEVYRKFKARGFEILCIDKGETTETVASYVAEQGVSWPRMLQREEGPILELYRVNGFPTYYLIDAEG